MSKIFIALLSATMALTFIPATGAIAAAPESEMVIVRSEPSDTWEINTEDTDISFPRSISAAFSEASERYQDGKMEILAMYARGIVSGVNYKMICRHTDNEGKVSLKQVTMYDPNFVNSTQRTGKARFSEIKDFEIDDYARNWRYPLPEEPVTGGMSLYTSGTVELPDEVRKIVKTLNQKTNIRYETLAYLGNKTTSDGSDYALLCVTSDRNDQYHDKYVDVVVVHSDNTVKSACSIFGQRTVFPNQFKNLCTIEKNTITAGDYVKVNFAAKGGTGEYTYKVSYRKLHTEKWYTKEFAAGTEYFKFKPAAATTYEITIDVNDGEKERSIYSYIWVEPRLQNTSSISAESAAVGDAVTVNADSKGGVGEKQYAVYYRRKNTETWHAVSKYSKKRTVKLMAKTADDYEVLVKVKDEDGKVSKKYFTVSVK